MPFSKLANIIIFDREEMIQQNSLKQSSECYTILSNKHKTFAIFAF